MIYICGHQNPDTDSIVAAIALSHLKGTDGTKAVRLGPISPETDFVLKRFGFPAPELIESARTQLRDIDYDHPTTVMPEISLRTAWNTRQASGIITLLVTDASGFLLGIVSPADIAEAIMHTVFDHPDRGMTLDQLCASISGRDGLTVEDIMKKTGLITFREDEYLDDVRGRMLTTRFRAYPVLNSEGIVAGAVSRYHLFHHKRKQFVLVDHNEKSQSVPGIEQAEILEIIDHHRLGDIQTGAPVMFRNEPVGSTNTIIASMFHEQDRTPEPELAGLMLAGILSDTVLYKSPTCTEKDRRMAAWLAGVARINDMKLGKELFNAFGSDLRAQTPRQIFFHDFKEYALGGKKIGIGQITVWNSDAMPSADIQSFMNQLRRDERFDLLLFMHTEIVREGTLFLTSCEDNDLLQRCFGVTPAGGRFFLSGMMSRKKQVVPALSRALS